MTSDIETAKCYHLERFIVPLYSIVDLAIQSSQVARSINDSLDDIPLPLNIETPQKEMYISGGDEEACFEMGASQLIPTEAANF